MNSFFAKDAHRFRITLSVCLALTLSVTTATIVLSVQYIQRYADEVKQSYYDADNNQNRIDTTERLADSIEHQSDSVARVEQIVADSKHYGYQNVIINDLRSMADRAGVTITSFDFTSPTPSGATPKESTKTDGLRSSTVGITLNNPVDYQSFLNFIHYIELNNTKMQVSSISLSALSTSTNPNYVNSDTLQIEVYVK